MTEAIGIRLDNEMLDKIKRVSKLESSDRSSIIRRLISLGYNKFMKNKAAEEYKQGRITLSEAAHKAEVTLWEMEQFLIQEGYKSEYSRDDLKEELMFLEN